MASGPTSRKVGPVATFEEMRIPAGRSPAQRIDRGARLAEFDEPVAAVDAALAPSIEFVSSSAAVDGGTAERCERVILTYMPIGIEVVNERLDSDPETDDVQFVKQCIQHYIGRKSVDLLMTSEVSAIEHRELVGYQPSPLRIEQEEYPGFKAEYSGYSVWFGRTKHTRICVTIEHEIADGDPFLTWLS